MPVASIKQFVLRAIDTLMKPTPFRDRPERPRAYLARLKPVSHSLSGDRGATFKWQSTFSAVHGPRSSLMPSNTTLSAIRELFSVWVLTFGILMLLPGQATGKVSVKLVEYLKEHQSKRFARH